MEIRRATEQDIPDLLRLLGQVGQVHHEIRPDIFPEGTIKYDATALQALLTDSNRPVFVTQTQDGVVGYCFCVHKYMAAGPASVERRELYIDDLCVDKDHHRMGIARGLYEYAVDYAKATGCGSLTLNVWCGNEGAMAFYAQMGLKPRNIMMELPLEESEC